MAEGLTATIVDRATWLRTNFFGNPRWSAPLEAAPAGSFKHADWSALVTRFVSAEGVDYVNFRRVRRLLGEYLSRLAHANLAEEADGRDAQLAFYLNAFNAIVVHQVLAHPDARSLGDIPNAFTRPYPVGRELLPLYDLLHMRIRAFGDPRIHAAVVPATLSGPRLRAYTAQNLDSELNMRIRAYLEHTVTVEDGARRVVLPALLQRYAGDFAAPERMPSAWMLLRGRLQPALIVPFIQPYLPEAARALLQEQTASLTFAPDDTRLNDIRRSSEPQRHRGHRGRRES